MSSPIYIVVVSDSRLDIQTFPYTDRMDAVNRAEQELVKHHVGESKYAPSMSFDTDRINDDWIWFTQYSNAGDHIIVKECVMDEVG